MGIVPENQHLLGLEGAGVIRRVGRLATSFRVGQRVMVVAKGTFGNRVIATTERTYPIPDSLSFEVRKGGSPESYSFAKTSFRMQQQCRVFILQHYTASSTSPTPRKVM